MALIKCRECGAEASSKAAACPKCGAPIKVAARQFGCGSSLALTVIGLFVVVTGINKCSGGLPTAPPTTTRATQKEEPFVATPAQMKAEFDRAATSKDVIRASEIANTLIQRYPDSPQAGLVRPYLPDLLAAGAKAKDEKAKADAARAAQIANIDVGEGERICGEIAAMTNALVEYTATSCMPAGGSKPGSLSFIVISKEPVFSVESSKKGWMLVVVAATAEATRSSAAKTDQVVMTDARTVANGSAFAISTAVARSLQNSVKTGAIELDTMYFEIMRQGQQIAIPH